MQTNILLFIFFSLFSAIVIRIMSPKHKRIGLLVFSILFYGICDLRFLWLLGTGIIWSYCWGKYFHRSAENKETTKLIAGITPIVIILCFFKYYGFFIGDSRDSLQIILPLGISYYSFKMISYMCDIHWQKRSAEHNIINYAVYITYFPQILCGPISRPEEILDKIAIINHPSGEMILNGVSLLTTGLFKKMVIADRLNNYVNSIFVNDAGYPAIALWMAAFFYSIQLYCDFSGYSDIAIGISNLLGLPCRPNFCFPEFSYSIKDFWNRWHISLSSWLRDYIYIPLGGNRKGETRKKCNILITFLVSGIWHGSTWNYIVWGIWHGLLNLVPIKRAKSKVLYVGQIILTYFMVMFGWIFFKAEDISSGLRFIKRMFLEIRINYETIVSSVLPFTNDYSSVGYLLTILLLIGLLFLFEYLEYSEKCKRGTLIKIRFEVYLGCIILFGVIGQNSFLYANY